MIEARSGPVAVWASVSYLRPKTGDRRPIYFRRFGDSYMRTMAGVILAAAVAVAAARAQGQAPAPQAPAGAGAPAAGQAGADQAAGRGRGGRGRGGPPQSCNPKIPAAECSIGA